MTYVNEGVTGAYRQTWRKGNPRSLLRTLIEKNPDADEQKIHYLFWREIEDDKELLRACVEYWCDHNYRSLQAAAERDTAADVKPEAAKAAQAAATQTITEQLKQRVEQEARTMLLTLMMPNEKPLRDCTGNDCKTFGGWFAALAKKVPATKTVGATLSETQVFQIWQRAKK